MKKHEKLKIEKALTQFVQTMNGQTFTNNGDYTRTLKSVANEYFDYCFELGYSNGSSNTDEVPYSLKETTESIDSSINDLINAYNSLQIYLDSNERIQIKKYDTKGY